MHRRKTIPETGGFHDIGNSNLKLTDIPVVSVVNGDKLPVHLQNMFGLLSGRGIPEGIFQAFPVLGNKKPETRRIGEILKPAPKVLPGK